MKTLKFYHNPGRLILIRLAACGLFALIVAVGIVSGAVMLLNLILETKN